MKGSIAIDIGGTKTAVASVNQRGSIVGSLRFATQPEEGFEAFLAQLNSHIEDLLLLTKTSICDYLAVGIGCPGPLNVKKGLIENPYTLPSWEGQNIVARLTERWQKPVKLENDANCALVGEAYAGAGQGIKNIVMLTFGTGVGGAVMSRGQIYRGADCEHPELGHVLIASDGPKCYCGQRGCLESFVSGSAFGRAAKQINLRSSHEIICLANQGDAPASELLNVSLAALEKATWIFLNTFLPDLFILGGGIADEHFEFLSAPMTLAIEKARQGIIRVPTRTVKAGLGNQAGLVGAASLAFGGTEV